ncbi:hypothetical protein B9Z19DRAFT_1062465 [Tuber borchii]|uniref:Uncharacterized protein n=1 Tax=Tuber borchii TaxID=42251 RepID=A0A2T7A1L5_TUBBO|nr:hypothetical protein B9Z19DRAFT_1062465 [Tuber borchii]
MALLPPKKQEPCYDIELGYRYSIIGRQEFAAVLSYAVTISAITVQCVSLMVVYNAFSGKHQGTSTKAPHPNAITPVRSEQKKHILADHTVPAEPYRRPETSHVTEKTPQH